MSRAESYERLAAICVSTGFVMAGQGVVSPVLPLYAESFGVTTVLIGATVTVFGLARLVTNIPAGAFADRRGRRWLLIGGPIVTAVGMIGSALASTIWMLLAARLVAGFGSALYMTGAQIYLIDIAADHQRARFIAVNQAALLTGLTFGPALGGLLATRWGLASPFLVVGLVALATAAYSWWRLPETLTVPTGRDRATGGGSEATRRLLRSTNMWAVGLVAVGVFAIRAGVRHTLVPLQLNQAFGLRVDELGVLFTALGIIGLVLIWPAGWAADRLGRKLVIVPPTIAMAVGVGLAAMADSVTMFVVGLAISAVGSSISGPAPAAYVADQVPPADAGTAMGLYRTFGDVGMVASPVLSGLLADATSLPTAIAANAVFVGAVGLFFALVATPGPVGGPRSGLRATVGP